MKTSKNIFNRKAFAFLGAAAFMFAAVFIAGCKTEVSSSDPVPETFALTFKPGEHGSVDAKAGGKAVATGAKLEKGTTVEFTATPESGYEVDKWAVTGGELVEGTGAEGRTTAKVKVTGDVTVNVSFKAKVSYAVTLDSIDPAKKADIIEAVSKIPGLDTGKATAIVENAPQVIKDGLTKAEADEIIAAITEAGGTASKSDKKTYTVEATVGEHGKIEASPKVVSKVLENTEVTFTAKPDEHYEVDKWTVTGGELVEGTGADGSTSAKVNVTANTNVSVNFIKKSYTVSFDAKGGSPVPETQKVPYGEKVNAPAAPTKDGYDFEGWYNKDGGAKWEFAVNTVSSDVDLYAKWNLKKYAVIFSVNGGNGSLSAKLDGNNFTGGQVDHGKILEFTATPNSEYEVDKWTVTGGELVEGTGADGSTSAKVKVTANTNVSVNFIKKSYAVTFSVNGGNGSLSAKLDGNNFTGGQVEHGKMLEFTANPDTDYKAEWSITGGEFESGTGTKGSTSAKVEITGNVTVSVTFTPVYEPVSFSDLSNYLQNTASSTDVNKIEVQGLTAADLKGNTWNDASPLGKILKANSDKKVALKFGGNIEGLTDMRCCFVNCTSLTQAPAIPTGVTNMESCFVGCTNLTQAPAIPTGVTSMYGCFYGCTNLTQAPAIPTGVTNMNGCFSGCTSLTQAPAIPTGVTNMAACFYGCTKLESAVLKCNYNPKNLWGSTYAFTDAFKDCTSLPVGGIKVPAAQLGTYRTNASVMGVPADRFVAE